MNVATVRSALMLCFMAKVVPVAADRRVPAQVDAADLAEVALGEPEVAARVEGRGRRGSRWERGNSLVTTPP